MVRSCAKGALTPAQCRMARAALELGVRDLAKLAGVAPSTITRLERGEVVYRQTSEIIQQALEDAGIIFVSENGEGPGIRLRKSQSRAHAHELAMGAAIDSCRLIEFCYADGWAHCLAPHALYQASDGSKRVRGSIVPKNSIKAGTRKIEIDAAHDDIDLGRVFKLYVDEKAPTFFPAKTFASVDIKEAVAIKRAVDLSKTSAK